MDDSFYRAISYEGKIYFLTHHIRFGVIDLDINNHHPALTTLRVLNHYSHSWYTTTEYLVESCGEIFIVSLIFHWQKHMASNVLDCKMDFSQMLWEQVESIDDRLFFLSESGSLSCSNGSITSHFSKEKTATTLDPK